MSVFRVKFLLLDWNYITMYLETCIMLLTHPVLSLCHQFPPNCVAKTKHSNNFLEIFTRFVEIDWFESLLCLICNCLSLWIKYRPGQVTKIIRYHIDTPFERSLNAEHKTIIRFLLVEINKRLLTIRPEQSAWNYVINHVTLRRFQKEYTIVIRIKQKSKG